jgi:CheY-like chemotaxis protein
MVNARVHPRSQPPSGARFNVLLTEDDRPRGDEHWVRQFPRLLQPQGVAAYVARTGQEAIDLAGRLEFHAAVIDLGTPKAEGEAFTPQGPGGIWLLELFRRLPNRPPTVLVTSRYHAARDIDRFLREALRLGVFSVIHQPVDLERMLAVFRSLVDRQYRGAWPPAHEHND